MGDKPHSTTDWLLYQQHVLVECESAAPTVHSNGNVGDLWVALVSCENQSFVSFTGGLNKFARLVWCELSLFAGRHNNLMLGIRHETRRNQLNGRPTPMLLETCFSIAQTPGNCAHLRGSASRELINTPNIHYSTSTLNMHSVLNCSPWIRSWQCALGLLLKQSADRVAIRFYRNATGE